MNTKDNNCSQKEEWECSNNSPYNCHPKKMGCQGGPCILTSCNRCICSFWSSKSTRISGAEESPKLKDGVIGGEDDDEGEVSEPAELETS